MAIRTYLLPLLAILLLPADGAAASTPVQTLRVLVANTAHETGLTTQLAERFSKQHPEIQVVFRPVGALVTLDLGRQGQADVIITHHPDGERAFIEEGFGLSRTTIFYNMFAVFGPPDDPLGLSRMRDPTEVLRTLADHEVDFFVPGHRSGTYQRLQTLWTIAGVEADWPGYHTTESSARTTLLTTAEFGGYTFADMATYLSNRDDVEGTLIPLFRDHKILRNYYSYVIVNPNKVTGANAAAAETFLDFLVSDETQDFIAHFGENKYDVAIYAPAASLDPGLMLSRAEQRISQEREVTSLWTVMSIGSTLAALLITSLYLRTRRLKRLSDEHADRFEHAVDGTQEGIFDWHPGSELYVSPRLLHLLGASHVGNRDFTELLTEGAFPQTKAEMANRINGHLADPRAQDFDQEFELRAGNARTRWLRVRGRCARDDSGRALRFSGSVADTTDIHEKQALILHQSLHDHLTDLPNRLLFADRLDQAIAQARRVNGQTAVMVLDINRFKQINDTLGHEVGDILIQEFAHRLKSTLRDCDTISRLSGDEFAILLPLSTAQRVQHVAGKVQIAMSKPFLLKTNRLTLNISIGVALFPRHGESADILLRHADVAMSQSKAKNALAFYDEATDPNSMRALALENDLRSAIEMNTLELHYQPKVELSSNRVSGVEALLRWRHPVHGFVSPVEFIGLAERTGLIRPLTRWVVEHAMQTARDWQNAGVVLGVAINLSVWDIQDPDFVQYVLNKMNELGVRPERLEFEITESAMMADTVRAVATAQRLASFGISLAVDDFGTGFSSLSYLKKFPVSILKIDRSFVSSMLTDSADLTIVRSTIEMAHQMGLKVVAEGVENRDTLQTLQSLGCNVVQGYHVCKPLPLEALNQWLATCPWGIERQPQKDAPSASNKKPSAVH